MSQLRKICTVCTVVVQQWERTKMDLAITRCRNDAGVNAVVHLLLTWVSGALTWDSMPGILTLFLCRYFKKTSAFRLANVHACERWEMRAHLSNGIFLRVKLKTRWNDWNYLEKGLFLLQMFADHGSDVVGLAVRAQFISATAPVLFSLVLLLQAFQHAAHLRHIYIQRERSAANSRFECNLRIYVQIIQAFKKVPARRFCRRPQKRWPA